MGTTIALAFVVLLLSVLGMAVGVLIAGKRIKGSCGGLNAIQGLDRCGVCGRDLEDGASTSCGKANPKAG